MKAKLAWMLAPFLVLCMSISFAQEKAISGNVTDQDGLPLPGVSIVVVGTTNGTQTDFDGNYSITAATGQVLRFSYIGQSTVEATIGASNTINVQMEEDAQALEEVVVVAYGSQTKKSLVGSVVSLGEDVLEQQQITTITSAIQGSVPGVNILASGGQPGENPTIRIRGIGSINASADPLIVVDGAPYNGNINSISADQIESMNVLKDASSTALYGSRGSNGVIVITTKSGRFNSGSRVQVTASTGMSTPAVELHDLMRTDQYMQYAWEASRNSLVAGGADPVTAGQNAADQLITDLAYNPYNVPNPIDANGNLVPGARLLWETDWEREMLRGIALRQDYGVSMSGGSEKTKYFLSANYLNQDGSVKTSNFERITTRLNLESQVSDWITMGLSSAFTTSSQNFPEQSGSSYQSSIQWIYSISSVYPLYRRNASGGLILDGFGDPIYDYGVNVDLQPVNGSRSALNNENAVGSLYNYKNITNRTNLNLNGFAQFDFTDWLTFRSQLTYEQYLFDSFLYAHHEVGYASSVNGRITQNRDLTTTVNFVNSINIDKSFGDHTIGADLIYESYDVDYKRLGSQGEGFLPNVYALSGRTSPTGATGYTDTERLLGYLGRVSYNYAEKYFIEGSYRRDGSTKFATDTRWGDFYSVGGSWVISDEGFLRNSNTVDLLKLRASYGELGNNRGIGYFPYVQAFNTGWNQGPFTGVLLGGVTDPLLTWEKTALANFGIDYSLFNNRISGSIDYYDKESVDLIYDQPLPLSTGNDAIKTNVGSVRNYGLEFAIRTRNIIRDNFTWTTDFNFSLDRNEITELTQESFISGTKRWEEGRSLYEFYIREWAGVDPDTGLGMWYTDITDVNGDPTGERETTFDYAQATRYYVGESLPDIIGGFRTEFTYKDFDLSALFNFSFGSQLYDSSYASLMSGFSRVGYQQSPHLRDRWQQPGDITDVPVLLASQNDHAATSTRFLFDNDYVRLKAITLGYNLPKNLVNDFGLNRFRLYLQGDNLFTWQSHFGVDPEQSIAGTTNNRSYILKTVSLGLNIEF